MIRFLKTTIIVTLLAVLLWAGDAEVRGTWVAWSGANVPSVSVIAETMDSLASANFNIVYVDVWRYGYPYFQSQVFYDLTGYYTDPAIITSSQPERDVLAEMIAEAHRNGLEVEAWLEAGFTGAVDTDDPLYIAKPSWFAMAQDGTIAGYGEAGLSLIQCHPEVQQFLIDLSREIIVNYDVDGINLDRIRYPSLDCGYDRYTANLYKQETGSTLPANTADADWIQWRADKLTEFSERLYDSLKTVNPDIHITNTPLPWGPEQYCQEWYPWINNGYLDAVVPQMYYTGISDFTWRLNRELGFIDNDVLCYPGISTVANGVYTTAEALASMIETCRSTGLAGQVIWYHYNLIWHANQYLQHLRETVYTAPAVLPYRTTGWRLPAIIIPEDSSSNLISGSWKTYTGAIPLYNGSCYYTNSGNNDTIIYRATITNEGWYEVYAFINTQTKAATQAKYELFTTDGIDTVRVSQKKFGNSGHWHKLADVYYPAGSNLDIVRLTAGDSDGSFVFADALMLLNTRRPEEYLHKPAALEPATGKPETFVLEQNFPNPFNSTTVIQYTLTRPGPATLEIFDLRGCCVKRVILGSQAAGRHNYSITLNQLPSGIYFYKLTANQHSSIKSMLLLK